MPYGEERVSFWKLLFRYWYLKILAIVSAFFLWLYVNITDKESFQWEAPIKAKVKVFPSYVYITGRVVSRLNNPEIFRKHIKIELVWNKNHTAAKVLVKSDIPKPILIIESYYPKRVSVQSF